MNNITRNSNKNKWTNSDLSSLTLWYNEGMPIDEIAKKLNKSVTSVSHVITTKKGTFKSAANRFQELKSSNELIHHQVLYIENMVMIQSITKINVNYFRANAFLADVNLSKSSGILSSEFTTDEACFRWFESLPDTISLNS